ncbi:MAG: hypothetical protein AAFV90_04035 [Cyanobacteria bacterium J06634_5]
MSQFNIYKLGATHLLKLLSHLPWAAKESEQKTYLKLVRKVVCYNQGKIADYAFATNESHKRLRKCYQHILNDPSAAEEKDYEALEKAYQEISVGLIRQFKGYAKKNFEFMAEFCELKDFNRKRARFCVKSATFKNQEYEILPIAGSVPLTNNVAYSAEESTGFSAVIHTGKYFLCNNIPEQTKARKYKNSRIRRNQVLDFYQLPGWRKNLGYRFGDTKDNSWIRCWENGNLSQQITDPSAFYKSTLVVPLSLLARPGDLSDAFIKNFEVHEDKIILGFLCLDHENINFFNHKADVDFAYIIADHLSLYWVHYSICTNQSSIFQKSYDLLTSNNLGAASIN